MHRFGNHGYHAGCGRDRLGRSPLRANAIDLESLVAQFSERDLPPVASWAPTTARDIDMRIDSQGVWHYGGTPIKRDRMVALFSTILQFDGQRYSLVTPAERLYIEVEDVPFVAVLLKVHGPANERRLEFTTNVGTRVVANRAHPLWISPSPDRSQDLPYLLIRDHLIAVLSRPVYYQLAELAELRDSQTGVWSDGCFMSLETRESMPPWRDATPINT